MNMGPISKEQDAMVPLPRSLMECESFRPNSTEHLLATETGSQVYLHLEDASHAFKISYLWYSAISLILQVSVSLVSSAIFGRNDAKRNGEAVKSPGNPEPIEVIA